jgi:hypothetical protein
LNSIKKPSYAKASDGEGGERGIRTPGGLHLNGFQDRRIRPLCHLSGAKIHAKGVFQKKVCFLYQFMMVFVVYVLL